jgi:catalase
MRPEVKPVFVPPEQLATWAPDFLNRDIKGQAVAETVRWIMEVTVAEPGDPVADPSQAWPAVQRTFDVATLSVQAVQEEASGLAATSTMILPCCLKASALRPIPS